MAPHQTTTPDRAETDARKDGAGAGRRRRRRSPLWARLAVAFGAALTLLSGTALAATQLFIQKATSNITQTTLLDPEAADGAQGADISGPINLLLVGIDVRAGLTGARSDSIIIVHVPASHDQAYLISIPRDWRVTIPGKGPAKINSAFDAAYQGDGTEIEKRERGFKLLSRTLTKETGIKFNSAAIIDFQGFKAVVKELGGVDMCVDQRASSIHLAYDKNGKLTTVKFDEDTKKVFDIPPGGHVVVHEKGCRRMSAELALDYARIRYGLPKLDYDRQRHQQQLIKAIAKEATSKGVLTDPGKLSRVIAAAGKAFVLDTQGVSIANFLFTLKGVAANDLMVLKTNNGNFNELKINGVSYQKLSDESMQMLHSVRDGKLAEFVLAHPNFISTDSR